ncbi:MAG: hypothetical protein JSS87_01270 [Acidobacteria bacterium]|nr:hypothetical protein [Acidobacteriota bacterium]
MALIARFLSPVEQGFYYTFGSLVAIQIVFELGFSYVVLQMASHEKAHLTISADYEITGDPVALSRLASVIQKSLRWYSVAAVCLFSVLLPVGFRFFSTSQAGVSNSVWKFPWCAAVCAVVLTFQIDPLLSFLEGCGYVTQVARLRFMQSVVGSILAWSALVIGHGLFAPAMMLFGMAGTALVWLSRRWVLLKTLIRHHPGPHRIRWMAEVWSFQWRIAISWLCGYFLFQLFNPVLFRFWGPVAAGQMGMSLSMANAVQAVAVSWVSTKSAPFGSLIALKKFHDLDHLFFRAVKQAVGVSLLGSAALWLICLYLHIHGTAFGHRILGPTAFGLLLLTTILNVITFAQALYLRAHKEEKFLLNSVVGALCVCATTIILGRLYGAIGMIAGYFTITILGIAWTTAIFSKYRRLWHQDVQEKAL